MTDLQAAEHQPIETDLKIVDGIFVKVYDVPDQWSLVPQHSHKWDHVTLVAQGAIQVYRDGDEPFEVRAPALVTIAAGVKHAFLTLEPGVRFCCIHNVERTGEIDVLEEHQLVVGA